jgi:glycosyltransferase involved in cell wall biosynthesis
MISVLILTKNEERDLPGCLASVAWCDDIHVLDSGSADRTCEIARQHGAFVSTRTYPEGGKIFGGDESAHRNWGLRNIEFRHPWTLLLDADERVTDGLHAAIVSVMAMPGEYVAFRIQRRDFFNKRWLKHVQSSPFYLRLFRPEKMTYQRAVNCVSIADGPIGSIKGYLDHFPFSKGMSHWLDRHNSYSTLEARQIMENRRSRAGFSWVKAFSAPDFHERRFHQKELFYRLPLRPLTKFMLLYLGKRGFLDGGAGLTYALLQAIYEYMIVLKIRELELELKLEAGGCNGY